MRHYCPGFLRTMRTISKSLNQSFSPQTLRQLPCQAYGRRPMLGKRQTLACSAALMSSSTNLGKSSWRPCLGFVIADNLRSLKFDSSSRDQPEARYYCPERGCKASFKRKYDIDRHFQRHTQSVNFFCPSEGCKYSEVPKFDRLSWDHSRKPLRSKLIEDDSDYGLTPAPSQKYFLYGFSRKDKLLKHLAKDHKVNPITLHQGSYTYIWVESSS